MELIDRQALDFAFTMLRFNEDGTLRHWDDRQNWCMRGQEVEDLFNSIPTIDAEPVRRGRWIWMGEKGDNRFMCSCCKWKENVPTCNGKPDIWDYCPSCGARMDGKRSDDD